MTQRQGEKQTSNLNDKTFVSTALIQAYLQTEYHVLESPPFILWINRPSQDLQGLHERFGARCSAYLTACNPCSTLLPATANRKRQQSLDHYLRQKGLLAVPGVARDPKGTWPEEDSFLVPGLNEVQARILGNAFSQNAIVCMAEDAIPHLILLHPAENDCPT